MTTTAKERGIARLAARIDPEVFDAMMATAPISVHEGEHRQKGPDPLIGRKDRARH